MPVSYTHLDVYKRQVDRDGKFIISSRGKEGEKDIFSYLGEQGNGDAVRETLRQVMEEEKSGTLTIVYKDQKSLLGFLPVEAPEGCYLLTVIPRSILQQEATPIICMLCCMFCLLLIGGISISALLALSLIHI